MWKLIKVALIILCHNNPFSLMTISLTKKTDSLIITEKIKNGQPVTKARLVARGFEEDSVNLKKD